MIGTGTSLVTLAVKLVVVLVSIKVSFRQPGFWPKPCANDKIAGSRAAKLSPM